VRHANASPILPESKHSFEFIFFSSSFLRRMKLFPYSFDTRFSIDERRLFELRQPNVIAFHVCCKQQRFLTTLSVRLYAIEGGSRRIALALAPPHYITIV
jgi:hypothetical protein